MGRRHRRTARAEGATADVPRDVPKGKVRLGRERPGSVTKGPPITVDCECGERRELFYGETWTCESCGRTWDTGDIPRDQYAAIRATQLRFRALPVGLGVLALAVAVLFTLSGYVIGVFMLVPVALLSWFTLLRPVHQRRYRRAIKNLPRWELHPR